MGAEVFILERKKDHGFYQNDMKCECIGDFQGWASYDYVMGEVPFRFTVEGSAVLSSCEDMGRVLTTRDEYESCYIENRKADYKKYEFYYRVEQPFFEALVNREVYKSWSEANDWHGEKKWVREQLAKFRKIIPTLDFEKNYYYITEWI